MRDHLPIILDKFNGLWARGNQEEVPLDHFSDCNNLQYVGANTFQTRFGLGRHQDVSSPLASILRLYNYPTSDLNTILVLTTGGQIYHVVNSTTIYGPILTVVGMTDFGFVPYGGRAYITPFFTETVGGLNRERGMQNQFLYVYNGDGTAARKAAGSGPTNVITVANGSSGNTDAGTHIFGYVYESSTGYLSPPGGLRAFTTTDGLSVSFSNVSNSPDTATVKKHIVASKVIQDYDGNINGYPLFFIPDADINNNSITTLPNISFFDTSLVDDASHLIDNFSEIPAGVGLSLYHNRLVIYTTYDDVNVAYVSNPGEPEAINQITGLLTVTPDGNPLTNIAELRDVLYVYKRSKTVSFVDNGDDPVTWPISGVDNAMGTGVHGIATVLDSGSSNIDYLIVATYKGITLFNGTYILPELTWKIQALWAVQDFKTRNRVIQLLNDPVKQVLYAVLTDNTVLYANYGNGFDPKNIQWCPWTFDVKVNTLCLINISDLILGCDQSV